MEIKSTGGVEKTRLRPYLEVMEKDQNLLTSQRGTLSAPPQAMLLREAVMTAYSITGNLSAATALCSSLVDEDLPGEQQASAVLNRLHQIAMSRPKH